MTLGKQLAKIISQSEPFFYHSLGILLTIIYRYDGYNKNLIDRFSSMGFDVDRVVAAFRYVGVERRGGQDYELEEGRMGDIAARLLGE